jgi:glycosyltransferase involved in cell wall biosynthesis
VAYVRLRSAIRRLRPDILVAHGGEPLKYLAFMERGGIPLIYFAFGIVTESARKGPRHWLYRALMNRAEVVAGISHEVWDEAQDLFGVPTERLVLLPNGRDPTVYRPGKHESDPSGPVKLIFVGHLTRTKRPDWFVAAVAELRRRGRHTVGEIVGDGPLEESIAQMAGESGVSLLGRRTDVPALLSQADVFVFTSVPESEGMPGVLIEAGMAGLPVVATDCPGVSTVLVESQTGFVVDDEDFDGLVAALERLVDDQQLRAAMGAAARRRCVDEFSLEASAARWREVLDRLVPIGP